MEANVQMIQIGQIQTTVQLSNTPTAIMQMLTLDMQLEVQMFKFFLWRILKKTLGNFADGSKCPNDDCSTIEYTDSDYEDVNLGYAARGTNI